MTGDLRQPQRRHRRQVVLFLALLAIGTTRGGRAAWIEGPALPDRRWHHAAAATKDGYVIVFGGRLLVGERGEYEHGLVHFAAVYFDPTVRIWRHAVHPPALRSLSQGYPRPPAHWERQPSVPRKPGPPRSNKAGVRNYELPFAGTDALGRGHWFVWQRSVYLDPRTGEWGQPEVPLRHSHPWEPSLDWFDGTTPSWTERSQGATATGPDGKIYLVGGNGKSVTTRPKYREVLAGLDIYDPATNEWRRGPDMKVARQALAAAFAPNGKLYVFGGCACLGAGALYTLGDEEEKRAAEEEVALRREGVALTEVYDPKTDRWSEAAPMPNPRMLFAAAIGADGRIYLIGGGERWSGTPTSRVDVYDPATDSWSRGPSLRVARSAHAAAVTGDGTIWAIGGYAAAPGMMSLGRLIASEKEGPTASVELLKTEKRR